MYTLTAYLLLEGSENNLHMEFLGKKIQWTDGKGVWGLLALGKE